MPLLLVFDREQLWRIRHRIRVALYSHESHIESRFGLTCQLSVIKSFNDERLFKKTLLLESNDLTNVITTETFMSYFPMACTLRHVAMDCLHHRPSQCAMGRLQTVRVTMI